MATPKVYVICDQNCKFEGMTKEQILTAISQAVENGEIKDIDAGFIQTVKTINGVPLRFFVGEKWAYDKLSDEEKENLFAIITNDTTKEELFEELEALRKEVSELSELVKENGNQPSTGGDVVNADYATEAGRIKTVGNAVDDVARNVWFSDSEEIGLPRKDDDFKYNPKTKSLTVKKINGVAFSPSVKVISNISLVKGVSKLLGTTPTGKTIDDVLAVAISSNSGLNGSAVAHKISDGAALFAIVCPHRTPFTAILDLSYIDLKITESGGGLSVECIDYIKAEIYSSGITVTDELSNGATIEGDVTITVYFR